MDDDDDAGDEEMGVDEWKMRPAFIQDSSKAIEPNGVLPNRARVMMIAIIMAK
jgi:hypothetical protein